MQIAVYGSGYVATIVSACIADFGTPVICFDADTVRLMELAQGNIPFYEKNLKEIIRRNVRAGRLIYSTDLEHQASRAGVIFLAEDDHRYVEETAVRLAGLMGPETVIAICTPSPVGTASRVVQRLRAAQKENPVVSHPLFLTSGCAVEDFNWPDRIILGTNSPDAVQMMKSVYRPLVMRGIPVIVTNFETAELVREASTAFVATKISFINELATLCEKVNGDAVDLALALGLDKRIAPRCLQPGVGLGGNFVEGDMESLAQLAIGNGVSLKVLSAAREVNRTHSDRILEKMTYALDSLSEKEVGLLGLAFKPNTNSVVGSASVRLARSLAAKGARVRAYDPAAAQEAQAELRSAVRLCGTAYEALEGVDALVVGTGWPEFRALDFDKVKRIVRRPLIVDTKNLLDCERLRGMGFEYLGIGRA
ncbi:MAG: UDP-glucose dehydrogenase family protein [Acidobacteriaceae bacterium]